MVGTDGRPTVDLVRIQPVDERDSSWEDHQPRFRVYFFRDGEHPNGSWNVDTYDVDGTDLLGTIAWAHGEIRDGGLYAVALVGDKPTEPSGHRRGLTWLVGMDANSTPRDEHERSLLEGMTRRRGRTIVADST